MRKTTLESSFQPRRYFSQKKNRQRGRTRLGGAPSLIWYISKPTPSRGTPKVALLWPSRSSVASR